MRVRFATSPARFVVLKPAQPALMFCLFIQRTSSRSFIIENFREQIRMKRGAESGVGEKEAKKSRVADDSVAEEFDADGSSVVVDSDQSKQTQTNVDEVAMVFGDDYLQKVTALAAVEIPCCLTTANALSVFPSGNVSNALFEQARDQVTIAEATSDLVDIVDAAVAVDSTVVAKGICLAGISTRIKNHRLQCIKRCSSLVDE